MDRKANAAFYNSTSMTPEKIFASSPNTAPDLANTFVQILTAQSSRLPTRPGMQVGTSPDTQAAVDRTSKVRTFGVPDVDESGDGLDNGDYESSD